MNATSRRYSCKGRAGTVVAGVCAAGLVFVAAERSASAQIKSPGSHPRYGVEVEPHLVLQWTHHPWHSNEDGLGLGARFNIPIIEDGPIKKINNSMAIGFGVDWVHFSDYCWGWGYWRGPVPDQYARSECEASHLWFPVVLQWNFWLTKVISVFGEPGLAIVHERWEYYWDCAGDWCKYDESDTDVEPVLFAAGARFLFTDTFGLTVRLGWPYASAGASLLF